MEVSVGALVTPRGVDFDTTHLSRIQPSGVQSGEALGLPAVTAEGRGILDVTISATGIVHDRIEVVDMVRVQEAVVVEQSAMGIATGAPQMAAGSAVAQIVTMFRNLDERLRRSDERRDEQLRRLEDRQARMERHLLSTGQPPAQYAEGMLRRHIEMIACKQTSAFERLIEISNLLDAEGLTMRSKDLARLLGISESTVNSYLTRIRDGKDFLY